MARYTGPTCKPCRRAGQRLCQSKNCAYDRRPYPPGEHGRRRIRESEYQIQLREKQKARYMYGILERQFRRYYREAAQEPGITGQNLLRMLETRLDNVVYRAKFASSRAQARQMVNHSHFLVNGRKVNIPSYRVQLGDKITLRNKSSELFPVQYALDTEGDRPSVDWLEVDEKTKTIEVKDLPTRSQIDADIREQLIVELYSK